MRKQKESPFYREPRFTFLIKFTLPTILSFVLMAVFGIVDQVFASRVIGIDAMALVNLTLPFLMSLLAFGSMISIGGSALISKKLGAGLQKEARENLTFLAIMALVSSAAIAAATWLFRRGVLTHILGANEEIIDSALTYMQPLIIAGSFVILGLVLVQFMIANGKPALGMLSTVLGAVTSTILNAIFLIVLDMGIFGLALATGIGYSIPAFIGFFYFTFARKGELYFVRPSFNIRVLARSMANGTSEFVSMMMIPITTIIMNNVLINMDGVGVLGVASAGIVMGLQGIFTALFVGYSTGIQPIVSYNYGGLKGILNKDTARNQRNLHTLFKKSLLIVVSLSLLAIAGAITLAPILVNIFETNFVVGFNPLTGELVYQDIHEMAVRGLRIIASGFILTGMNVFATCWFTAFNDWLISGLISLMQTCVFTVTLLLTLPRVLGLNGVWMSLPLAEVLTISLSVFFLVKLKGKYKYAN